MTLVLLALDEASGVDRVNCLCGYWLQARPTLSLIELLRVVPSRKFNRHELIRNDGLEHIYLLTDIKSSRLKMTSL